MLELCVQSGVKSSFNCITIDGDMSTNDTVLVMANGASGVTLESPEDIYAFQQALAYVMLELAKHIVQDGGTRDEVRDRPCDRRPYGG